MTLDALDRDYDYIIVDTPPSLNVLTDNALVATGNVVIPVIPEKLNANSLQIFAKRSTLSNRRTVTSTVSRLCVTVLSRTASTETPSRRSNRRTRSPSSRFRSAPISQSIGEGVSVFGFGKENKRVEDARKLFNEIADLFDETFEKTAPEEVEA